MNTLSPSSAKIQSHDEWWAKMEEILASFEFMEEVERDRSPPVDDIESFDDFSKLASPPA